MASQKIIDYIKAELSAGKTEEEIREVLVINGYSLYEINEAFFSIKNEYKGETKASYGSRKGREKTLLVLIVVAIAAAYFVLFGQDIIVFNGSINSAQLNSTQGGGNESSPPAFPSDIVALNQMGESLSVQLSLLNKTENSEELKMAKASLMSVIGMTLEQIRVSCEEGLGSEISAIVPDYSACAQDDIDCALQEAERIIGSMISVIRSNIGACAKGMNLPEYNKSDSFVKGEIERYLEYEESVLEYIKSR